ncbi:MAG: NAD(P)/FAD-dependent oxidoreductase [Granulosicoccus sp.]
MTQSASKDHCVVIGAGIVGVSTGIWLARAGRRVTIVDRLPPGEGTSHGNAGVLASCSMVPVTTPGLAKAVPGLLINRDSPLFLRWSYLPKALPWGMRYLSYANDKQTRRISQQLSFIVSDSLEQHQDLAGNTQADKWLVPSDYQFAYRTKADYEADSYVWSLRRQHGFEPEMLFDEQVREKEPVLGKAIQVLACLKNHGHVRSPGKYVKSLAEVFKSIGGEVMQASVHDIPLEAGQASAVITDGGTIRCDSVVIATGVWSGALCSKFNLKVPMESERGYHVIFRNPNATVSVPTMITSGKFVATPMHDGMRCAGIVELGGLQAGPSKAPIELIMRRVKQTFPTLEYTDTVEWMGHRPAPADSLPFIGQIGSTGVYTAFGHHHIGLTGGPKTGRLLAELICGERDQDELEAFRPDRYS